MSDKFNKEWKVNQISREDLNDQLYDGMNILNKYLAEPSTHSKAYDSKLLIREIVDNIYKYDSAFSIRVEIEINAQKDIEIKIIHNGSDFDPFDPKNNCNLIRKIKDDITFKPSMSFGDSMKRIMKIKFNLVQELI